MDSNIAQFLCGYFIMWLAGTGEKRSADEGVKVAAIFGLVIAFIF